MDFYRSEKEEVSNIILEETKDFKQLIEKCKKQDPDALEKFFEIYSIEIYNFPMKVFHFTEEEAGDFFLFAFERLRDGKRFRSFRGDSSFRTWFYSVLRNLVLDWIRANKKSKVIQFYNYASIAEIEKQILKELESNDKIEAKLVQDLFYRIIENFDEDSRIIFKLVYIFYLNLDEDDIHILKTKYKKTGSEILQFISEIKEYLTNKNIKLKQKSERLHRLYLKLLKLKEKEQELKELKENQDPEWEEKYIQISEELTEIQAIINKKTKNRDKMIEHTNPDATVLRTPFQKIAEFLEISTPTVSSIYKKAENQIKNSQELKKIFIN
ncbi:MAG: DNA-directed RNA polymerase sigma-70 factor [Leptospiraceae bacterium]|nr:MAG: DNA-directed RNA polymerase sigma-70 factor [Leptospiraceae bacterium]